MIAHCALVLQVRGVVEETKELTRNAADRVKEDWQRTKEGTQVLVTVECPAAVSTCHPVVCGCHQKYCRLLCYSHWLPCRAEEVLLTVVVHSHTCRRCWTIPALHASGALSTHRNQRCLPCSLP